MKSLNNLLAQKLSAANYSLTEYAQTQLCNYLLLLDKWNRAYNLTSVRNISDMITLHILDSLSILPYLQGRRIIDVGTGAGLPGIPLAIAQPECEFVLLDSNGKKTRFLLHVLQELHLTNVEIVQARVENYQPEKCFDTIISRAFSSLAVFAQTTKHLCGPGGQLLAMKGQYPLEELAALSAVFSVLATHELLVPELNAQRHLVCLKIPD